MKESFVLLLWWVLFGGSHMVMSSPSLRPKLVSRLGERGFLGLYSLIAIATLVPLCMYYGANKHAGPQFWVTFGPYLLARDLNLLLMLLAFALLASGLAARPPSSMLASGEPQAYGVTRITRHPTFASFFVFGLAHCFMNGTLADLMFFGGLATFAWLGARHQDERKRAEIPGYAEFQTATSFMPFGAILNRRQSFPSGELRWGIIIIGLISFYVVRSFHPGLFGGILMTF